MNKCGAALLRQKSFGQSIRIDESYSDSSRAVSAGGVENAEATARSDGDALTEVEAVAAVDDARRAHDELDEESMVGRSCSTLFNAAVVELEKKAGPKPCCSA